MPVTIPQVKKNVAWEEAVKLDMSVAVMKLTMAKWRGRKGKVAPSQNPTPVNVHVLSPTEPVAWSVGVQTVKEQADDTLPMPKKKLPASSPSNSRRAGEVALSVADLEQDNQQGAAKESEHSQIYVPQEWTLMYLVTMLMMTGGVALFFFKFSLVYKFFWDLHINFVLLVMEPFIILNTDEIMEWLDQRFLATISNDGN